ncbi:MAG: hypothetical protein K2X03_20505 [Bryobacteraceae bacterium]|nr:hypothetical protein [Bryobacteraceae bacterium]
MRHALNERAALLGGRNVQKAVGIGHRRGPHDERVGDTEDRRIGADADSQRQHGHRREAGLGGKLAERVAQVGNHDSQVLLGRGARGVFQYVPNQAAQRFAPLALLVVERHLRAVFVAELLGVSAQ